MSVCRLARSSKLVIPLYYKAFPIYLSLSIYLLCMRTRQKSEISNSFANKPRRIMCSSEPAYLLTLTKSRQIEQRKSVTCSIMVAFRVFALYCSNCCVNPIVYCFLNESFQKHLLRTLRCRCITCLFLGVKGRRASTPGHAVCVGTGTSPVAGGRLGATTGGSSGSGGGSSVRPFDNRRRRRSSSCTTDTAVNGTTTLVPMAFAPVKAPAEHANCTAV